MIKRIKLISAQSKIKNSQQSRAVPVFYACLFLILSASIVSAANFGSTTRGDYVTVEQGQSAQFTLLFWNSAAEVDTVHLETTGAPDNWLVTFGRNDFPLSSAEGNEMISSGNGYVRASSVSVTVDAEDTLPGVYNVTISAKSYSSGSDINFAQERTFNLKVEIKNNLGVQNPAITIAKKNLTETNRNNNAAPTPGTSGTQTTETGKKNPDGDYIYYIIVFIIILGAVVIYRRV